MRFIAIFLLTLSLLLASPKSKQTQTNLLAVALYPVMFIGGAATFVVAETGSTITHLVKSIISPTKKTKEDKKCKH